MTGGAGYIGAHVVRLLQSSPEKPVVVDDLSNGDESRIPGVPIIQMDISNSSCVEPLADLMKANRVNAVIHFAAKKRVDESIQRPAWYYEQNVGGLLHLLAAMDIAGVKKMVFSSSAAVYGETEDQPVTEDSPVQPINPYGRTKLIGEWILTDKAAAGNFACASLRYFNVAGCTSPELGDRAVLNLVPMVFEKIDVAQPPLIFGDDYPTADGTCIRDYIHVQDLAEAHVQALSYVRKLDHGANAIFNIGTGTGTSVREMIRVIREVSQVQVDPVTVPRREGDPANVTADVRKSKEVLGWESQFTVKDMISSAWESHEFLRNE